jgi:hypothetical protein
VNVEDARSLAADQLAKTLPRRWSHVEGVGRRASALTRYFGSDGIVLACAGWLHDIGYAPALAVTGFHPIDGARYLRSVGIPQRITDLVANHSCAALEAAMRGLGSEMADFADEGGPLRDALTYCDITTSPDGDSVSAEGRISEIKRRYGPEDIVTRFITVAAPEILMAVGRTQQLLQAAASQGVGPAPGQSVVEAAHDGSMNRQVRECCG